MLRCVVRGNRIFEDVYATFVAAAHIVATKSQRCIHRFPHIHLYKKFSKYICTSSTQTTHIIYTRTPLPLTLQLHHPTPRLPSPSPHTPLPHQLDALRIIPCALLRLGILRRARHLLASQAALHRHEVHLLLGRIQHVLGGLLGPPVDEIAMRAPRIAARELDGRLAVPATGQILTRVPADGEAQLGHGLHAGGTRAAATVLVGGLEGGFVDAVWEEEELLEVSSAGAGGEAVLVEGHVFGFAAPGGLGVWVHGGLGGGGGLAGDHHEVLRDGHLGGGLAQVVVGGEAEHAEGLVGFAAVGGEEGGGDPVGGEVVGVVGVGAALLELGGGGGGGGEGVGAEEGVEVGLGVGAGEDDGVDVFGGEGAHEVDLGVGGGSGREGEDGWEGRHGCGLRLFWWDGRMDERVNV